MHKNRRQAVRELRALSPEARKRLDEEHKKRLKEKERFLAEMGRLPEKP